MYIYKKYWHVALQGNYDKLDKIEASVGGNWLQELFTKETMS